MSQTLFNSRHFTNAFCDIEKRGNFKWLLSKVCESKKCSTKPSSIGKR